MIKGVILRNSNNNFDKMILFFRMKTTANSSDLRDWSLITGRGGGGYKTGGGTREVLPLRKGGGGG